MTTRRQYLLVDGYNVAHAWADINAVIARDIDAAAMLLVERLAVLHDGAECEVTIVFDGRGEKEEIQRDKAGKLPCVIYSPAGVSADAIIEQIVARAPNADDFTVASRDNALVLSVHTYGGHTLRPEELAERVEREKKQLARTVVRRVRENGRDFGNKLF